VKESDETNNKLIRSGLTCPLPDLIVSSLSATGVTVKNSGAAPSSATTVSVSGVGSFQVPGLKAGAFHAVTFPVCTAGTRTAKVDPGNAVKESDEANNSLTRSGLTCPLPDLVIGGLNVTRFTVSNNGKGDAGAFSVLVERSTDGGATFGFVASFPFSGLPAGRSRTGQIPNCVAGILRATADSGHQVKESNESNNVRTATVTCPLPDLVISSVAGTSVTVQNVGHATAGPFVVGINDPAVSPINVSGLAAGASRTANFAPCLTSYTATADANNQVQESKENNNQKSGSSLPCPDLIIKALTKTSVTVLNQGTGAAGASQTRVQPVGKFPTQPLGAGDQQTFTYPCVANKNMGAIADVDNQVVESVEGNNQATAGPFTCPHAKPGGSSVQAGVPPAVPAWRRD